MHYFLLFIYFTILLKASIQVDNGRPEPKFEKIFGDHSIKLNGRIQPYLKNTNNTSCGINYFTFDSRLVVILLLFILIFLYVLLLRALHFSMAVQNHVDDINGKYTKKNTVLSDVSLALFEMLKETNPYCRDLQKVGRNMFALQEELNGAPLRYDKMIEVKASLNASIQGLTVGTIVSDDSEGLLAVTYKIAGRAKHEFAVGRRVEPLLYPLFYPWGEDGWFGRLTTLISYHR